MNSQTINIEEYAEILEPLVTNLEGNSRVYDDPVNAFEGWIEDGYLSSDQERDWLEPSLIIWIEEMNTWRFNLQSNTWNESAPDEYTDRIFRILPTGVMSEILPDGKVTSIDWFPIGDPHEAFAYLEFLFKFSRRALKPLTYQKVSASSIIQSSYVPFYRYPDDLSLDDLQLTWTDTQCLQELIKTHLDENLKWMEAPLVKLKKAAKEARTRNLTGDDTSTPDLMSSIVIF